MENEREGERGKGQEGTAAMRQTKRENLEYGGEGGGRLVGRCHTSYAFLRYYGIAMVIHTIRSVSMAAPSPTNLPRCLVRNGRDSERNKGNTKRRTGKTEREVGAMQDDARRCKTMHFTAFYPQLVKPLNRKPNSQTGSFFP